MISPYNKKKIVNILFEKDALIKYDIDQEFAKFDLQALNMKVQCTSRVSGSIRIIELRLDDPNRDIKSEDLQKREDKKEQLIK